MPMRESTPTIATGFGLAVNYSASEPDSGGLGEK